MEKFLQKIQLDINKKLLACVQGESIIKPFTKIYNEVRDNVMKNQKDGASKEKLRTAIYSDGESSIYDEVVKKFLEEHPELKEQMNKDKEEK